MQFNGSYTHDQPSSRITLAGGSLHRDSGFVFTAGTVEGGGTLTGAVTNGGALLSTATGAGRLNITGAYTQQAGGILRTTLRATTDAGAPDRQVALAVTGAATFAGALEIVLASPFAETLNAAFPVVSYASRAGDFATVTGLSSNFGYDFTRSFQATALNLNVTTVGVVPAGPAGLLAPTDFSHWITQKADEAGITENLQPLLDADGDGASNLLEYAFGTHPFDSSSLYAPLPFLKVDDGVTRMALEFRRRIDTAGLDYQIESSFDLILWNTVTDVREVDHTSLPGNPGLESIQVVIEADVQPVIEADVPLPYLRMRILTAPQAAPAPGKSKEKP